jgi:N-acetylglutamate synthase-like GNAT family acetyltransferase
LEKDRIFQRLIVSRKNCQIKKSPDLKIGERMEEAFTIREFEPDKLPEIERIFEAQGLENSKIGVEIIKGYAVEVFDRLIGGAEVMLQEGEYTFSVAIDDPFKGRGIGKSLFQRVKKEIHDLGAKKIMIQAKTPEYWEKFGFMEVVDLNGVPKTFRCDDCSQYGIDCFPKIMVLDL